MHLPELYLLLSSLAITCVKYQSVLRLLANSAPTTAETITEMGRFTATTMPNIHAEPRAFL